MWHQKYTLEPRFGLVNDVPDLVHQFELVTEAARLRTASVNAVDLATVVAADHPRSLTDPVVTLAAVDAIDPAPQPLVDTQRSPKALRPSADNLGAVASTRRCPGDPSAPHTTDTTLGSKIARLATRVPRWVADRITKIRNAVMRSARLARR